MDRDRMNLLMEHIHTSAGYIDTAQEIIDRETNRTYKKVSIALDEMFPDTVWNIYERKRRITLIEGRKENEQFIKILDYYYNMVVPHAPYSTFDIVFHDADGMYYYVHMNKVLGYYGQIYMDVNDELTWNDKEVYEDALEKLRASCTIVERDGDEYTKET